MGSGRIIAGLCVSLCLVTAVPQILPAKSLYVATRSSILVDTSSGRVLYEQNADARIAPASITKVMTLFLLFDAIHEGRAQLGDQVVVSARAAATGGSRMGLKAGERVPLGEIIKGIAVVSGNDAAVAAAEHLSGDVQTFVRRMNAKARELGMYNSMFMTPNGLPASGQLTTARDLAKLAVAYLRLYPESLSIHSMTSYTHNQSTHRNANRLLGKCSGVDGLKTGFVCASGYNLAATAKRGDTRLLAVVLGAQTAGIRARETEKLLEAGFQSFNQNEPIVQLVSNGSGNTQSVESRKASKSGKLSVARKTLAASKSCGLERKKAAEDSCADPVVKIASRRKLINRNPVGSKRVEKTKIFPQKSAIAKSTEPQRARNVALVKPASSSGVKKSSAALKTSTAPKNAGLKNIKKTAKAEDVTRPTPSSANNGTQSKSRPLAKVEKKR
jgi:D-alanyl-D-alanine carboxypeptidase